MRERRDATDIELRVLHHEALLDDAVETFRRQYLPQIVEFTVRERLPGVATVRPFAALGGLMSYGANLPDVLRKAADYLDRVLKGANPADLPFEQPTKFELVINLKTAKTLGLILSPLMLSRADEVIE